MDRGINLGALAGFGIAWGLTIPLGKVAASTGHHPIGLVFWQVTIVALVLGLAIAFFRIKVPFSRHALIHYAVLGILGTVIPNSISYHVATKLPAGILSIVIATVPMFSVMVALLIGSEKFQLRRIAGVALGLVAVILLVAPQSSLPDRSLAIFVLIGLVPPLCYGLEGNYVASFSPQGMNPIAALFGASLVSALLVGPIALAGGIFVYPAIAWGHAEWALVLSSVLHAVAYGGYIWLLGRTGAVFTSQVSYIVTFAGVFASAAMLGETYSPTVWMALLVMVCGMALVQPRKRAAIAMQV